MPITTHTQVMKRAPELRRPETDNKNDYWYCSKEQWGEWMAKATENAGEQLPAPNHTAWNNLCKMDWAGRLVETNEGVAAGSPCSTCAERHVACYVLARNLSQKCAFCRVRNRTHCSAALIASGPADLDSQRRPAEQTLDQEQEQELAELEDIHGRPIQREYVQQLEIRIAQANVTIAQKEAKVDDLERRLDEALTANVHLEAQVAGLQQSSARPKPPVLPAAQTAVETELHQVKRQLADAKTFIIQQEAQLAGLQLASRPMPPILPGNARPDPSGSE